MNNKKVEILSRITEYLPKDISAVLLKLDDDLKEKLCEIRLKSDMPVVLIFTCGQYYITKSGRITAFICADLLITDKQSFDNTFSLMCRYSVYSYAEQINKGFISLSGGVRVGVYGTAVTQNSEICSVRCIKGLNIRIPGTFPGCSDTIAELFAGTGMPNVLICGPPLSGKTTVLKDLCRTLSDRFRKKVCVIDERFEFESEYLGLHTDVLSGYPKHIGMEISVRSLSPEIIVLDEIGMNGETEKIIECMNSGVSFVMSIHCFHKKDLYRKNQFLKINEAGAVDYCVLLSEKSVITEMISTKEIQNEADCIDCVEPVSRIDRTVSFAFTQKAR